MTKEKDKKNHTPSTEIIQRLGLFRTSDAIKEGVSQRTLSRMVEAGTLSRLEHGIFLHPDFERMDEVEFIQACLRFGPDAAIGGLTAFSYYAVTEQVPTQTWVMVSNSIRNLYPKSYRVLRTKHDLKVEIEEHEGWRIVSLERAIIEAFVYHTKIGYQTALIAARTALSEKKITEKSLATAAERLQCWPQIAKNWEAITTK
ncbi:type IV toxin-antitoxin system AbiEi family antitoxin domain-containing protein [Oligoflexus tunisiensis]|uniref:type IV toxin-antitoxin system AbiEi family antitoxin domain-containing protein n=1 Tax=Oligoflexus tunisiensis TaxID=708132 RepID=UPI00114D3A5C|nr:type IV toxin-antitoxin system AbiEi family antitoxin domain-containing protein [Oligoflexus tunisiensis]